MIETPDISDENIIESLNENYSIRVSHIEFLPIGNDPSAFAYRVEANDRISYFLKLKKELSNLAGLFVPRFLKDNGINQVIPPLQTNSQELWAKVDEFALVLYPYINGNEAMKVGMTDAQWTEFGDTLKRIHTIELSPNVLTYVQKESFIPKWSSFAKSLGNQVNARNYDDPYQRELALFWRDNKATIQTLIDRTEMIGNHLQQADLEFVPCHADIHTANILLHEQDLFIVDWDDTLLAPKERDLMFVLDGDKALTREQQLFLDGYGDAEINLLATAYYRYEWCVQEIGDFGERVFLSKDAGETTKQDALEGFIKLFSHGDVVEAALSASVEALRME